MSLGILGYRTGGSKFDGPLAPTALFPTAAVEGCLCRVWVAVRTKNGTASSAGIPYEHSISLPSGWTLEKFIETANAIGVDDHQLWLFSKLLTAADIAAGGVQVTSSGDRATRAWVVTVEDVADAATPVPFSDSDFDTSNTDPHNVPGFTTTANDAIAWVVTTDRDKIDSIPGDLTQLASHKVGGDGGLTTYEARLTVFYRTVPTAGAVGPWSIGLSSSDDYAAISSWTKPDAGATPQSLTGEDTHTVRIRFGVGKISAPEAVTTTERDLADPKARIFPIVKLSPYKVGTGVEDHYLGFRRWLPGSGDAVQQPVRGRLAEGFEVTQSIFRGSRIGGRGIPTFGEVVVLNPDIIRLDAKRALSDWFDTAKYRWSDRDAELFLGGYDRYGVRIPSDEWLRIWKGASRRVSGDHVSLVLEMADAAARFEQPAQGIRFAGTGGLEGGSDWTGKTKPRGAGVVRNAPLAWVDPQNGIGVFHADSAGYACREVLAVKSRLNPLTPPSGGESAQYSVTLGAVNYIQLQTGLDREQVTIDFVGPAEAGDTLADIAYYFLVLCGGPLDAAEWDSNAASVFAVECPGQAYHFVPAGSDERLGQTADALYTPLGWWTMENGVFRGGLVPLPNQETADTTWSQGSVRAIRKLPADPELAWLKVAYARSWTTFDRGQVAEAAFGTEHGEFGIQEYRLISAGDTSAKDTERLAGETQPWVVPLSEAADAQELWDRGWELNRSPSELFEVELDRSHLNSSRLVRIATLTHDAFNATRSGANLLIVHTAKRHDGLTAIGWKRQERKVLAFFSSGKKFKTQAGKLLEIG